MREKAIFAHYSFQEQYKHWPIDPCVVQLRKWHYCTFWEWNSKRLFYGCLRVLIWSTLRFLQISKLSKNKFFFTLKVSDLTCFRLKLKNIRNHCSRNQSRIKTSFWEKNTVKFCRRIYGFIPRFPSGFTEKMWYFWNSIKESVLD